VALYDGAGGLLDPMGVRSIPGLAFINEQGVVVAAATGNRDRDFILRHARALKP
jgi:hypothetical protein